MPLSHLQEKGRSDLRAFRIWNLEGLTGLVGLTLNYKVGCVLQSHISYICPYCHSCMNPDFYDNRERTWHLCWPTVKAVLRF